MTFKLLNRVRMSVSGAAGTGTITVNLPAAGGQSFTGAGMSDGDTTPYVLEDGSPVGASWEIGVGTWHSNGTFSRDTVTQSSAGGTTKISATANAILSATFRSQDLTSGALSTLSDVNVSGVTDGQFLKYSVSAGKWVPVSAAGGGAAPTVVQYGTIQTSAAGNHSITLGAAPTAHNHLIAFGQGGGSTLFGSYSSGFNFTAADKVIGSTGTNSQYGSAAAIRSVRSGDSATQIIGSGNTYEFNGVLVEVSGIDVTRFSSLLWTQGSLGSSATLVDALAPVNALTLLFVAAGTGSMSISSPATVQFNNDDGTSRLVFAYNTAAGDWNGISASTASTNTVMVLNLPGF